jgi:CheY-like chemotaxis protein
VAAARLFDGMRVLLAEDNPVNQRLLVRMLEKLGCAPEVAVTGLEAVEKIGAADYALVLMDCQMPEMDGLEATRLIRQRYGKRGPPIVALTAAAMKEQREQCVLVGMDDFVTKPVSLRNLEDVLSRWASAAAAGPQPPSRP